MAVRFCRVTLSSWWFASGVKPEANWIASIKVSGVLRSATRPGLLTEPVTKTNFELNCATRTSICGSRMYSLSRVVMFSRISSTV